MVKNFGSWRKISNFANSNTTGKSGKVSFL